MSIRALTAAWISAGVAALCLACSGKEPGNDQQAAAQGAPVSPLTNPNAPEMNETAPDVYTVKFETSAGDFEIEVTRAWSPRGADRFYNLVKRGWYDDNRFFRVLPGFVVQFGINGDPEISKWWRNARIADDPVVQPNTRGTITFAKAGPDTRTTQVFINFGDNSRLDADGFSPFGRVTSGMPVVDRINAQYGDAPSRQQGTIQQQGNAFLQTTYPNLDYIKKASIVP